MSYWLCVHQLCCSQHGIQAIQTSVVLFQSTLSLCTNRENSIIYLLLTKKKSKLSNHMYMRQQHVLLLFIDLYNSKTVKPDCRCDLVASNERVIPSKNCFISGNDLKLRTKSLLQIYNKKSVIREYFIKNSFCVYLKANQNGKEYNPILLEC